MFSFRLKFCVQCRTVSVSYVTRNVSSGSVKEGPDTRWWSHRVDHDIRLCCQPRALSPVLYATPFAIAP
jgi:hypothetical protein